MDVRNIILAVVFVVMVCGALIPITSEASLDHDQYVDDSWHYDDYKIIANVESADGALEIVTLSGVDYVHADDVGAGTITYSNGNVENIDVSKADLDVIVALGQSNNAYVGYDASSATCPEIGMAYYFGTDTAPINGDNPLEEGAMHPMVSIPGTVVIGDKGPSFCAAYAAHSYHKVYYISGARSGSSIGTWQPGGLSWNGAATVISNAMDAIDISKFNVSTKCYTWIQGESNYSTSAEDYYNYFVTMHNSILDGNLGIALDHCFISKVRSIDVGPSEAQIKLAEDLETVTMATEIVDTFTIANGLLESDGVHYSQAGDNLIGKALGESAADYYYPYGINGAVGQLVSLIPVLVLAGLVLGIVVVLVSRRE